MRALVLCLSMALISHYAASQTEVVKDLWYLSTDVPFSPSADFFGLGVGLNYVHNERLSFQLSLNHLLRDPQQAPPDLVYEGPSLLERGTMGTLEAGRIFRLDPEGTIRLNLKGGVALMKMEVPTDWTPVPNPCAGCNNYTYEKEYHLRGGVIIRPTLEIPSVSVIGFTVGPMLILAKGQSVLGWNAGMRLRFFSSAKKAAREKKWRDRYLAPGN
jgi:hypothetical protein